jgi:hypothetical protein
MLKNERLRHEATPLTRKQIKISIKKKKVKKLVHGDKGIRNDG